MWCLIVLSFCLARNTLSSQAATDQILPTLTERCSSMLHLSRRWIYCKTLTLDSRSLEWRDAQGLAVWSQPRAKFELGLFFTGLRYVVQQDAQTLGGTYPLLQSCKCLPFDYKVCKSLASLNFIMLYYPASFPLQRQHENSQHAGSYLFVPALRLRVWCSQLGHLSWRNC